MDSLLIFGGTFDPPHLGHINTDTAVQKNFHFDRFIFLPCKNPVLKKKNLASSQQRIDMLRLATADMSNIEIDTREVDRKTPSYMIETLKSFHEESPKKSITLLIGMDALLTFTHWHEWKAILELCNLLVIKRPQYSTHSATEAIQTLLSEHEVSKKSDFVLSKHGKIFLFDAGSYPISSTQLRQYVRCNLIPDTLLSEQVLDYIVANKLYQ